MMSVRRLHNMTVTMGGKIQRLVICGGEDTCRPLNANPLPAMLGTAVPRLLRHTLNVKQRGERERERERESVCVCVFVFVCVCYSNCERVER